MEGVTKKHVQGILLFSVCMLLAYAIFHGAYVGPWDENLRAEFEQTRQIYQLRKAIQPVDRKGTTRLTIGKPGLVPGHKLVFRGLSGNRIQLDVYILALDADYAYRHIINVRDAKKGFLINGERYRLISCSPLELVVKTVAPEKTEQ